MSELVPRRVDTSSTVYSELSARDHEELIPKSPGTPTRLRASGRRLTLSHRKLVFYDPVAFRYLEEDDSTIVLARRERLQGYELYIVEQWVCSRVHPTFVITTYTGDPTHSILVNVLAVPSDEKNWSKRLKIYFDAVSQFQAREQETPLGTLMVTNLSAFPSVLTVIAVPDGDVKKHREDFIVNENLKRMGCSGRAAMNLQPAPPNTVAKFQHLYQVSESIPFNLSVMELVRLCQTALVLYGKLNPIYADGLLCDITEKAIQDWWNEIGTDFHNVEPSDGVLGPTTVSAMVGLMIGAHHRLRATGVNVPKDTLDTLAMKRAIGHFQKAYKVKKTRRLDRDTLDRLHRVTAKTASSEGWAVPRAVKSTVAELSGKGGEMVMGAIGANKEKVTISEVETLDIDKLAHIVSGEKMRWLWQGKALKSGRSDVFGNKGDDGLNGKVFSADDQGNFSWTSKHRDSQAGADDDEDPMSHDRSSLKRLRGAVGISGLRSHHARTHKHSEDHTQKEDLLIEPKSGRLSKENTRPDHFLRSASSFYSRSSFERQPTDKMALDLALASADTEAPVTLLLERVPTKAVGGSNQSDSGKSIKKEQLRGANPPTQESNGRKRVAAELRKLRDQIQADDYQKFATEFDEREPETLTLRRSKSALQIRDIEPPIRYTYRLPRQLSFSVVEGSVSAVLSSHNIDDLSPKQKRKTPLPLRMSARQVHERELKSLTKRLTDLEQNLFVFAEAEVVQVEGLDRESQDHLEQLNAIYYQRLDEYQSLQGTSRDVVLRERAILRDSLRKVEMLGQKLDYELDALQSRMQEVEDGAEEFERNVLEIEARVAELVHEQQGAVSRKIKEVEGGSTPWLQRAMNFFGSTSR